MEALISNVFLSLSCVVLQRVCVTRQKEHEHLESLTAEMHTVEEKLQEERTERVKLEVELGREKDCNRVRKPTKALNICHLNIFFSLVPSNGVILQDKATQAVQLCGILPR